MEGVEDVEGYETQAMCTLPRSPLLELASTS
jgi:hypothetical protein